jgi:hypothetical protein
MLVPFVRDCKRPHWERASFTETHQLTVCSIDELGISIEHVGGFVVDFIVSLMALVVFEGLLDGSYGNDEEQRKQVGDGRKRRYARDLFRMHQCKITENESDVVSTC